MRAAAVVVMTAQKAAALGLKPIVRLVDAAAAGVPPEIMGIGPVPAVKKLLKKTGIKLEDIGRHRVERSLCGTVRGLHQ